MSERLHKEIDRSDPTYILYSKIIDSINLHVRGWMEEDSLSDYQKYQAICSAMLAQAAHHFRNNWKVSKDDFLQMASEEWDMHDLNSDPANRLQ